MDFKTRFGLPRSLTNAIVVKVVKARGPPPQTSRAVYTTAHVDGHSINSNPTPRTPEHWHTLAVGRFLLTIVVVGHGKYQARRAPQDFH